LRIGDRVNRTEDDTLLRGLGAYVDDLVSRRSHDGAVTARAVFVRSPYAHARVLRIDTTVARNRPGVSAVFTATDLSLGPIHAHRILPSLFDRPPLAHDVVRFVGDAVAVVLADTIAQAVDAAEHVVVDYEPLPALADSAAALRPDAAAVYAEVPGNAAFRRVVGDRTTILANAEVVVTATMINQRVASAPMEPDGALAVPDAETVTVWASTQRVHQVREQIASSLVRPSASVRVIAPQVGGGFGGKFEPSAETVVVAAAACRLGHAVAWVQTRTENLLTMPHGRGQVQQGTIAVDRDGTFVGLWADIAADGGAYPMVGAVVPNATLSMIAGPYRWRNGAGGECVSAITHTPPVGAYRGAGRPEATALIERLVDLAAMELGTDPVALRLKNLVERDAFPYTSATGMTYDSGDYSQCVREVVRRLGLDMVRIEQARRVASGAGRLLGIAITPWLDCTPMNRPGEFASVHALRDDAAPNGWRIELRDGANDQGQAHQTTWRMIVSDALGLDDVAMHLYGGDTAFVDHGEGTGSARSLQLAGSSMLRAAREVRARATDIAAELLEANPDDLLVDDRGFGVRGTPTRQVAWADVLQHAGPDGLRADSNLEQPGPTFPSGAHGAVVEVDPETGHVRVVRFVAVDDCGRVVNPVAVEGQQHGGIAQGIGQALYEAIEFDGDGTPLATNFADYLVPCAADLCWIDAHTIDLPSPINPLGAKGIGQAGAIGSTPAIQNAVVNALAHIGVRHIDLPLSPERVWAAIRSAQLSGG
jgi:carbon-monoxide dehydrogenase large subunit